MKNLIFRRQFILANKPIENKFDWKAQQIDTCEGEFHLLFHPELKPLHFKNDKHEILALGYFMDPYKPEYTDEQVFADICKSTDLDGVLKSVYHLNGRYVILYNNKSKGELKIFNDATAYREVYFYTAGKDKAVASTPNLIKAYYGLKEDTDNDIKTFFDSPEFNNNEKIWIGAQTIVKGVFHLLPNHCLDMVSFKAKRFWPYAKKKKLSIPATIDEISKLLEGTITAATKRYEVYQGLTAGFDTRMLLSGTKKVKDKIKFYLIHFVKKGEQHEDFVFSQQIAKEFKLDFNVIELTNEEKIDPEFERIFFENNHIKRRKLLSYYYFLYSNNYENTTSISGIMGNEILRVLIRIYTKKVNAKNIAEKLGYQNFPFVVGQIEEWLKKANAEAEPKGYNVLDLFSWEQFFGHWGAQDGREADILRDEIRAFNCRKLLELYSNMPDSYRYQDYPMGHIKVIKKLWPDILKYPIVPSNIQRKGLKEFLRKLSLEQPADTFYNALKEMKIIK